MSATYADVTRVTREIDQVVCDLCKAKAARGNTWPEDSHKIDEVKIQRKTGTLLPGCADIDEEKFDVCPDCWESKVVPFLESLGAKSRNEWVQW